MATATTSLSSQRSTLSEKSRYHTARSAFDGTATIAITATTHNNKKQSNFSGTPSPTTSPSLVSSYQKNSTTNGHGHCRQIVVTHPSYYTFYDTCAHCGKPSRQCRCGCVRELQQGLKSLSPPGSPLLWVNLNAMFIIYSTLLLWLVYEGSTDDDDDNSNNTVTDSMLAFAQEHYLVYDFVLTLFWCWQTFLNLVYFSVGPTITTITIDDDYCDYQESNYWDNGSGNGNDGGMGRSPWATGLELLFGLLFLVDSGHTLYLWNYSDQNPDIVAVWVLLNLVAYIFEFVECMNVFRAKYLYDTSAMAMETTRMATMTGSGDGSAHASTEETQQEMEGSQSTTTTSRRIGPRMAEI